MIYSMLGLSTFFAPTHGVMINGWEEQNRRMALTYFLGLAALNFSGAVVYAARIPERWFPRRFDIIGSSHQTLHVMVVFSGLCQTMGVFKALEYWQARRLRYGDVCKGI